MTFVSLNRRIEQLPLVLAGPVLRRTGEQAVTVWLALKEARTVRLEVVANAVPDQVVLRGERPTVRLGERLHVVAVTARPQLGPLEPGQLYLYDLDLGNGQRLASTNVLSSAGGLGAASTVAYPGLAITLPSFSLPPQQLSALRIVHGSCRKAHGEGFDALAALDTMLAASAGDALGRPHHLFLTGDQIYGDDVADALLHVLVDARTALGLPAESLPAAALDAPELRPGRRGRYATDVAGMSAVYGVGGEDWQVAKSHLLTFAEYSLMYLFAWSPVLWPAPGDLPAYASVFPDGPPTGLMASKRKHQKHYDEELAALERFRATLAPVRRALANVATYMIFDDHDVTDDWFINQAWCDRVLKQPAGRQVVQNALLAYALFQAWGNTPDAFEQGWGAGLLAAAQAWTGSTPILASTVEGDRLRHPATWPSWSFRVLGPAVTAAGGTGPRYEVVVIDPRTWRAFPGSSGDPAALIDDGQMAIQLPQAEPTVELSFVVAPAPVVGNPLVESIQELVAVGPYATFVGDREMWELHRGTYEALLARLAARGAPGADGRRQSRVVLLSGDVHYGFTTRLQYWGDRPFRDLAPEASDLVAAQLTSSACKNEESKTHLVHAVGYGKPRRLRLKRSFGWRVRPTGQELQFSTDVREEVRIDVRPWTLEGEPPILDAEAMPPAILANKPPDWVYRRDYLGAEGDPLAPGDWALLYAASVAPPLTELAGVRGAIAKLLGRSVVGVNNLGEVRISWGLGEDKAVTHALWWRKGGDGQTPATIQPLRSFTVSLSFKDANYPRPTLP
jgi:hypothetical protein